MSVELSRSGDCALLTLNRPEALNALSFAILKEIGEAVDEVSSWRDVRALLVAGAGQKAFCAGADIKELRHRRLIDQKRGAELGQAVFAKLDTLPITSVALVNGYAFGGGCELALACTFRLASAEATFGLPEIKLGLIPGYGGTQRLPRLVGDAIAITARAAFMQRIVQGHGFTPLSKDEAARRASERAKLGYVKIFPEFNNGG